MSKLSTKNIKVNEGESSIPKQLLPGNELCLINSIELRDSRFNAGEIDVILHLEGPALVGEFVGFFIDKDDPEKGNYKGQIGRVRASFWSYKDGITKGGIEIKRDDEIMKLIKQLCDAMKISAWFDAQDDKHDTIQQLVDAFNNEKPSAGKPLHFCIAGKEYLNKKGYKDYDLFLPKFTKTSKPFTNDSTKVTVFDAVDHIIKPKVAKAVESFDVESTSGSDFDL